MSAAQGADDQAEPQNFELSLPQLDTSSQVRKTISGITGPIKKERATKAEMINKRSKVS